MPVVKHKKLSLKRPTFKCDEEINKHNTLYPFKHLNKYFFLSLIGRSGSGKTSMLYSLLTNKNILKKSYNHIVLFMPQESINSIDNDLFNDLEESNVFNELTPDDLYEVSDKIRDYSSEDENTLLIIDDMGSYLKNKQTEQILKNLIWNKRHLKLSIIVLVQVYNSIPLGTRKSITDAIIFHKPSIKDIENISDELIEKKKHAEEIADFAFRKQYDWLYIHVETQTIYNNDFEELQFINKK